jgi:SAM-dependent methyltransferase
MSGRRDAQYLDAGLVALYDALNPLDHDSDFYLSLPSAPGQRIVDLGCGTGLLAVEYARRGHRVTGVDPSEAMLAFARSRPDGYFVGWYLGDAQSFASDESFDLITMTGHVFQHFLDDDATLAALQAIRVLLAPGGRLVFETRNPTTRAWTKWTPGLSRERVVLDDVGEVVVHHDAGDLVDGLVSFGTRYHFARSGEELVSHTTLRFPDHDAVTRLIGRAGLTIGAVLGDWNGRPFADDSREMIFVVGR